MSIAILLLTFQRTDYCLRTIEAARRHLRYDGRLCWYLADDGSHEAHYQQAIGALDGADVIGSHTEHRGYGGNVNAAFAAVREQVEMTLVVEDDWVLRYEFDLTPHARLLQERTDIGMVRLGYLNLNMSGRVFGYGGQLYWRLDRDADPYVFTGHPSLRHLRFWQAYGDYPIGPNPGDTELAYASQYRYGNSSGPEIVWPAGIGQYGPFDHVGTVKSYG